MAGYFVYAICIFIDVDTGIFTVRKEKRIKFDDKIQMVCKIKQMDCVWHIKYTVGFPDIDIIKKCFCKYACIVINVVPVNDLYIVVFKTQKLLLERHK